MTQSTEKRTKLWVAVVGQQSRISARMEDISRIKDPIESKRSNKQAKKNKTAQTRECYGQIMQGVEKRLRFAEQFASPQIWPLPLLHIISFLGVAGSQKN